MRADAQDNRDRVLAAARELFAERGLDVTMREVARRAGVGPATLYRRFPTRRDLLDAAFADELHACRQIVEDGCADPDPWRGFCTIVERICVLNARNQGFVDAFTAEHQDSATIAEHRASLLRRLRALTRRAQAAGGLRPDFVIGDFVLVLAAGRGLPRTSTAARVASARRFAALAVEAFRASADNGPLPGGTRLVATATARRPGG